MRVIRVETRYRARQEHSFRDCLQCMSKKSVLAFTAKNEFVGILSFAVWDRCSDQIALCCTSGACGVPQPVGVAVSLVWHGVAGRVALVWQVAEEIAGIEERRQIEVRGGVADTDRGAWWCR